MSFRRAALIAIWIGLSGSQACSSTGTTDPQPAATDQSVETESDAQPSDVVAEPDEEEDATDLAAQDQATDQDDSDSPDDAEDGAESDQPTDAAADPNSESDAEQEDLNATPDETDGDDAEAADRSDSADSESSDSSDSADELEATDTTADEDTTADVTDEDAIGDPETTDEPTPDVIIGDDSSTDGSEDVEPDPIEAIRELFPEIPNPDPCIEPPDDQAVICGRVNYLSALAVPLPASGALGARRV